MCACESVSGCELGGVCVCVCARASGTDVCSCPGACRKIRMPLVGKASIPCHLWEVTFDPDGWGARAPNCLHLIFSSQCRSRYSPHWVQGQCVRGHHGQPWLGPTGPQVGNLPAATARGPRAVPSSAPSLRSSSRGPLGAWVWGGPKRARLCREGCAFLGAPCGWVGSTPCPALRGCWRPVTMGH